VGGCAWLVTGGPSSLELPHAAGRQLLSPHNSPEMLPMLPALLIATTASADTLLVHGGPMLGTRVSQACLLAPTMTHVVLGGSEVEMYAMQGEVRRTCPEMLPKTTMLHFYANNTADHVVCALQKVPAPSKLTQIAFEYHMERVQRTSALVQHLAPQTQWLYVSLANPPNVAWRIRDEQDRYLPQVAADVHAALSGPCAVDRC
jgi:hypothetical protein